MHRGDAVRVGERVSDRARAAKNSRLGFFLRGPAERLARTLRNTANAPRFSPAQSEPASGSLLALRGLNVTDDGIAVWVKVASDPKAFARIERASDGLHVTDIFRGGLPAGSGSQILATGLRAGGLSSGQKLVFKGIINQETLAAYRAGESAASSLLGRLGGKALGQVGLKASSFEFQMVRGKLDLVIGIK